MHFFMFNRIASDILPYITSQIVTGFFQVREASLNLLCRILSMMASSVKR